MNVPARPSFLNQSARGDFNDEVLGHLGGATPPYLSIKGNKFTLVETDGSETGAGNFDQKLNTMYFDCVIVDALDKESKIYYAKDFDPNAQGYAPPDCWSDNGVAASRNASNVPKYEVGALAGQVVATCMTCPKAEWGSKTSKVSGKGVPACGKYQKLAIIPYPVEEGDHPYLVRVPPNSLANLREYLAKLKRGNEPVHNLITRLTFVDGQVGTLQFQATAYIDEPTWKVREQCYAANQKDKALDNLVGRGDVPRSGETIQIAHQPANERQMVNQIPQQYAAQGAAGATIAPANTSAAPATTASPSEPPKRRGRKPAASTETTAPPGAQTAPFRPAEPPAQNGQAPQNFGIQQGSPADPKLASDLDSIFGAN